MDKQVIGFEELSDHRSPLARFFYSLGYAVGKNDLLQEWLCNHLCKLDN